MSLAAGRVALCAAAALAAGCTILPPDLSACRLAHGFVLGEGIDHPGAIEIWSCPGEYVATLTEFVGTPRERERRLRSHFALAVAPGDALVGCRDDALVYRGLLALTSQPRGDPPPVARAWQADLEQWQFAEVSRERADCRRGPALVQ